MNDRKNGYVMPLVYIIGIVDGWWIRCGERLASRSLSDGDAVVWIRNLKRGNVMKRTIKFKHLKGKKFKICVPNKLAETSP